MYNILIVEDDRTIATLLAEQLQKWGFQARCVRDFNAVMAEFEAFAPHLVLLDIGLPFYNGYYWCGEIRKRSKVPIVFLSSHTENMDIVMAVNMGGDDYIVKPFSMPVLVAKINALLRRAYDYYGENRVLSVRGAMLDLGDASLRYDGEIVALTKNEFRILLLLFENKNSVVAREQIMKKLWDSDSFIDDNTLTVNINRLRKKLDDIGLAGLIVTKKGLGYMVHD